MPRLRRYLPLTLILLPVIFICGKLLLTPVRDDQWNEPFHYGWPWEYQSVSAVYNRQTSEYDVGQTLIFDLKSLLEDFAILLGAVVVCGGALTWWWRHNRCRFRFSLRAMLIWMAIFASAVGWAMIQVGSWQREQRSIKSCAKLADFESIYCGPAWSQRLLPEEGLTFFRRTWRLTIYHELSESQADKIAAIIPTLPYLQTIECHATVESVSATGENRHLPLITPSRFPNPTVLKSVVRFRFKAEFDDAQSGVLYEVANNDTLKVLGALPDLNDLRLSNCPITDHGIAQLANCRKLTWFNLTNSSITDNGLAALRGMSQIERLDLSRNAIGDAGIANLIGMQKLRWLNLNETKITDIGFETLGRLCSLELLEMLDCPSITDRNLLLLLECQHLRSVLMDEIPHASDEIMKWLYDAIEANRKRAEQGLD